MSLAIDQPRVSAPSMTNRWLASGAAVLGGVGLLLVALAYAQQRDGDHGTPLFWCGLMVALVPAAWHCASPSATRGQRAGLLVVLSFILYMVKALHDPLSPTAHDELASFRTTSDILLSGHLYETNPVVSAYSDYPGLHLLASQVAQLSGASLWTSALVTVGIARLIMTVAIYLLLERLINSRLAAIGVLVYMSNPGFLLFDARFAYESLALPLALAVVAILACRDTETRDDAAIVSALCVAAAVVVTHHVSSVFLSVVLLAWALLGRWLPDHPRAPRRAWLVPPLLTIGYLVGVAGGSVLHELGPVFHRMWDSTTDLVTGNGGSKQAFGSAPGQRSVSQLEKLSGFVSVALALSLLAVGAWRFRKTKASLAAVLVVLGLVYPLSLVLRLTDAGTETANRASEYVFLGIGLVAGTALVFAPLGVRPLAGVQRRVGWSPVIAIVVALLFAGGVVIGNSWYSRLPGRYLVSADPRSIDAQSRAVADWARAWLPAKQRWAADRENALTITAFARQDVMVGKVGSAAVPDLFFSPPAGRTLGPVAQKVVDGKGIRYVLVDRRLSRALPADGYYFERGEPDAGKHHTAIPLKDLDKFAAATNEFDRPYDGGAIVVYRRTTK